MANFGKLNFSTSFNPTSAFPIDARCYFTSLAEAEAAAATAENVGSTNTVYYFGMKILVSENNKNTWYEIKQDSEGKGRLVLDASDKTNAIPNNTIPPTILQPNVFYQYGTVKELSVQLADEPDQDYVYEYMFEFIADKEFTNLTITPVPTWVRQPNIVSGKIYQVSILNGIGVIVGA